MKLSRETLAILKNYAAINPNILLTPEKVLMSATGAKNVFSKSSIVEEFPIEFGVYDINEFISVLSLFSDPDLEFSKGSVNITQGNSSILYVGANKDIMQLAKPAQFDKLEEMMAATVTKFDLSGELFSSLIKTASVLKAPDVSFKADGTTLKISISDLKNTSSNKYDLVVGPIDNTFNVDLKVDNLKMPAVDYVVSVSKEKAVKFTAKDSDSVYYVAFELTSKI